MINFHYIDIAFDGLNVCNILMEFISCYIEIGQNLMLFLTDVFLTNCYVIKRNIFIQISLKTIETFLIHVALLELLCIIFTLSLWSINSRVRK
jgi:hypothetical protein